MESNQNGWRKLSGVVFWVSGLLMFLHMALCHFWWKEGADHIVGTLPWSARTWIMFYSAVAVCSGIIWWRFRSSSVQIVAKTEKKDIRIEYEPAHIPAIHFYMDYTDNGAVKATLDPIMEQTRAIVIQVGQNNEDCQVFFLDAEVFWERAEEINEVIFYMLFPTGEKLALFTREKYVAWYVRQGLKPSNPTVPGHEIVPNFGFFLMDFRRERDGRADAFFALMVDFHMSIISSEKKCKRLEAEQESWDKKREAAADHVLAVVTELRSRDVFRDQQHKDLQGRLENAHALLS